MRRCALTLVVVLAGCSGAMPVGTPYDSTAVFRPASMVADRETAAPGDIIELTFPEEDIVGVGYAIEQEVGTTWVWRYTLFVAEAEAEPGWYEADRDTEVPAMGITDPVRVAIPEAAEPGTWRICTIGGPPPQVCVRIEVVEGGSSGNPMRPRGVSAA
jgi:hypothetical protein